MCNVQKWLGKSDISPKRLRFLISKVGQVSRNSPKKKTKKGLKTHVCRAQLSLKTREKLAQLHVPGPNFSLWSSIILLWSSSEVCFLCLFCRKRA
jgi:hypothetical protein